MPSLWSHQAINTNYIVFIPNLQAVGHFNADVLLNWQQLCCILHPLWTHTEIQLLARLPTLLANYKRAHGTNPLAVLLYTRGTACFGCTQAIIQTQCNFFPQGQFIVAYLTNMVNNYMNPTINCKNRHNLWNNNIAVYCVWEPGHKSTRKVLSKCMTVGFISSYTCVHCAQLCTIWIV